MSIAELYEWACSEGVENCALVVRDLNGKQTYCITPEIIDHDVLNGVGYIDVELEGDVRFPMKELEGDVRCPRKKQNKQCRTLII